METSRAPAVQRVTSLIRTAWKQSERRMLLLWRVDANAAASVPIADTEKIYRHQTRRLGSSQRLAPLERTLSTASALI
ncbi:hypothetical protein EYF80_021042 [Liparis tanakae]|uniref:Uncharacterized protein n=1 Tax=Liparis tanakae TaxID=230148 RepID=A0A4Z2HSU8_9TELE|nr:hypothetical protein EYF80_021042 [Liparis tanakae]